MGHANTAFLLVWQKTEIVFYIELHLESRCVRASEDDESLVNIIAACLCHKLCVSSCWGMCQRFVSAARDSSCSGQWPVTRPSVSVSIIELKFLQSMSGSVTNQRKVNNVQQAVWVPADQSAATVRAD